jgi:hypothetical protein
MKTSQGHYVYSVWKHKKTGEIIVEGGGLIIDGLQEKALNMLKNPGKFDTEAVEGTLALIKDIDFTAEQAKEAMGLLERNFAGGPLETEALQAFRALKAKYHPPAPPSADHIGHRTMVHARELQPPRDSDKDPSARGSINGTKGRQKRGVFIDEHALAILEGKDIAQLRPLLPTIIRDFDITRSITSGLEQRFKAAIEGIIANPKLREISATAQAILEEFEKQQAAAPTNSRMTQPAMPPVTTPERIETEKDAIVVLTDTAIAVPLKASEDNPINKAIKYLIGQTSFSQRDALLAASERFKNTPIHNLYAHLVAIIAGITGGEGLTLELIESLENKAVAEGTKKIIAASISQGKIPFENEAQISRAIAVLSPKDYAAPAVKWLTTKRMSLPAEPAPTPAVDPSISETVEKAFGEAFGEEPKAPAQAPKPLKPATVVAPPAAPPAPAPKPAAPPKPLTEEQVTDILNRGDKEKLSGALLALSNILGKLQKPRLVVQALRQYAGSDMDFIRTFSTTLAENIDQLQQIAQLKRRLQETSTRLDHARGQQATTKAEIAKLQLEINSLRRDLAAQKKAAESSTAKLESEINRLRGALAAHKKAAESSTAKEQNAVAERQKALKDAEALRTGLATALEYKGMFEVVSSDKTALEKKLADATSQVSVEPLNEALQALKSKLDRVIRDLGAAENSRAELIRSSEKIDEDIMALTTITEGITSNYNMQVAEEKHRFAEEDKQFGSPIDKLMGSRSKEEQIVLQARRAAIMTPYQQAHEKHLGEIESQQRQALANIEVEVADLRGQAEKINASLAATEVNIGKAKGEKSDVQTEVFDLLREIDRVQTGLKGIKELAAQISDLASDEKKA